MSPKDKKGPAAPAVVERLVKQLNITYKAVKLYPLASNIPRDNARVTLTVLHQLLQQDPEVRLDVTKDGLIYETLPVYAEHPAFMAFAREFYSRGLAEVRFHSGTSIDELLRFLSLLDVPVSELMRSGGFENRLWELGVNNIAVKEVLTRVVESGEAPEDEDWPPPRRLIDDILAQALGRRPRAQRLLMRLIADEKALAEYVTQASSDAGPGSRAMLMARRFAALAHAAEASGEGQRGSLQASLAAALRGLDPDLVRDTLGRLLAEARNDPAISGMLRAIPLEELCTSLLEGATFDPKAREELARTVRNLVALGLASRDTTMDALERALDSTGLPAEVRAGVLEDAAPSRLRVRERRAAPERPGDTVLHLLDMASTNVAAAARETDIGPLADEATRGITDGDVFGAMVTVATLEERDEEFASIMALLENNLGLLVERQDFEVAADVAEALVLAERKEGLAEVRRNRLHAALAQLARPDAMRALVAAMRVYRPDTPEHDACRRLLTLLGEHTVGALLEVLADEKDMANRKALVDMISGMADRFIPELGDRVSDGRWYFVRNVVAILGATHDPRALSYLERTLRHHDARVRRETIRGIAGIRDAKSGEMLVAALRDDDAGNVQLAARYLGSMKLRGALPALEEVARGEGVGNRDTETRIEAIEALGRTGAPESTAVLEAIARQRGGLRASRSRELRTAAENALNAIRLKGGGAA